MKIRNVISLGVLITLFGCGGGSSSNDSPTDAVLKGIFLDSAVEGIHFKTATQEGDTDENGTLLYKQGEEVTLSIGGITLPAFEAKETMSPLDVFDTEDITNKAVVNLAILLQSLDADSDPSNGIKVPTSALNNTLTEVDFNQETSDFIANGDLITLVSESVPNSTGLVSATDASNHLQDTLVDEIGLTKYNAVEYTNLILGKTTTFGDSSYFYRKDGKRFTNQDNSNDSEITETNWSLDDSGAICEITITNEEVCATDVEAMATKIEGSESYTYYDNNSVSAFTIRHGDPLNLSLTANKTITETITEASGFTESNPKHLEEYGVDIYCRDDDYGVGAKENYETKITLLPESSTVRLEYIENDAEEENDIFESTYTKVGNVLTFNFSETEESGSEVEGYSYEEIYNYTVSYNTVTTEITGEWTDTNTVTYGTESVICSTKGTISSTSD